MRLWLSTRFTAIAKYPLPHPPRIPGRESIKKLQYSFQCFIIERGSHAAAFDAQFHVPRVVDEFIAVHGVKRPQLEERL